MVISNKCTLLLFYRYLNMQPTIVKKSRQSKNSLAVYSIDEIHLFYLTTMTPWYSLIGDGVLILIL